MGVRAQPGTRPHSDEEILNTDRVPRVFDQGRQVVYVRGARGMSGVGDRLVLATNTGFLRNYDISDPTTPDLIWDLQVGGGVLEATPAIWEGTIYIGSRDGYMYAVGE